MKRASRVPALHADGVPYTHVKVPFWRLLPPIRLLNKDKNNFSRFSPSMELIRSDDFYILQHVQKGESNLWISRHTGQWEVRPSWDLAGQENLECLGLVWALYGKLSIHPDLPDRLVLVKHCDRVAELPGGPYSPNSLQGKNPSR